MDLRSTAIHGNNFMVKETCRFYSENMINIEWIVQICCFAESTRQVDIFSPHRHNYVGLVTHIYINELGHHWIDYPRMHLYVCMYVCMYRLWLHSLYGLYGPWCPLSPKRLMNLISLSLSPTLLHWEEKCAHFSSEWSIVGYGTVAFWDLWIRSVG